MSRAPFPLLDLVPSVLRDVLLGFHWDTELLHALQLPSRPVAVSDLAWHLELPFWSVDGVPFQVSPAQVAADPATHQDQWDRAQAADIAFALDGHRRADGRLVILDGIHRLLKASVTDRGCVAVRVLPVELFDAIAVRQGDGGSISHGGGGHAR